MTDKPQTVPSIQGPSANSRKLGAVRACTSMTVRDLPSLFAVLFRKTGTVRACTGTTMPSPMLLYLLFFRPKSKWVLTGPQVYGYVDFSIKSIVSTETNLTITEVRYYCVYLRRSQNSLEFAQNKIGFN